jgi:hypothetical protein
VLATLAGSGSSAPSGIAEATTATQNFSHGVRIDFTAGWWTRYAGEWLAHNVIAFLGQVNSVDVARVRFEPIGAVMGGFEYHILLTAGGSTVTAVYIDPDIGLIPPRIAWPGVHTFRVRVGCSTYDGVTNRFDTDGYAELLMDGSSILSLTGLTIARYNSLRQIGTLWGALNDTSRIWLIDGTLPITVDADGYPDRTHLTYYDDFSSGLGTWTGWSANAAGPGPGSLPSVYTTGGAADGPCISFSNISPYTAGPASNNAFAGMSRSAYLVPWVVPEVITPPGPPPTGTECEVQQISTVPPNAGCSPGGRGFEAGFPRMLKCRFESTISSQPGKQLSALCAATGDGTQSNNRSVID